MPGYLLALVTGTSNYTNVNPALHFRDTFEALIVNNTTLSNVQKFYYLIAHASQSHASSVNIKLPVIALPVFNGETCSWLHFRDTFEALIVNNTTLSNVQKCHYLIASLKDEAKDLICNLPITHDNFLVAWQLVTQRYNNKRLIAMMHAKHLCQMPQVRKRDASSLRQLINMSLVT